MAARKGIPLTESIKATLRREAQRRRQDIHDSLAETAAAALADHGTRLLDGRNGRIVSGYWPIRSEPDLRPLLGALANRGREIVLPVVLGRGTCLKFHAWAPGDPLVTGPMGTVTPALDRPERDPEIMLVPLLAFDRSKQRLGYGGGYYDRTIAALRAAHPGLVTIGIAYSGLEIAEVPVEPWDQALDMILTEQGFF